MTYLLMALIFIGWFVRPVRQPRSRSVAFLDAVACGALIMAATLIADPVIWHGVLWGVFFGIWPYWHWWAQYWRKKETAICDR